MVELQRPLGYGGQTSTAAAAARSAWTTADVVQAERGGLGQP